MSIRGAHVWLAIGHTDMRKDFEDLALPPLAAATFFAAGASVIPFVQAAHA
jgi:hypothetical protein